MNRKDQARWEMLTRVRDFGAAHPELFPDASEGALGFAAVAAAADVIKVNAVKKLRTAKDGQEALAAARALVVRRMRVIAATAKGILRLATADPKLRMPARKSRAALLTAATAFIADAEQDRDRLQRLGMPSTSITELAEAIAALEKAATEQAEGRAQAKSAEDAIRGAFAEAFRALRTLDIVVLNATRSEPALLSQWTQHRRVVSTRQSIESAPEVAATTEVAGAVPSDPQKKAS